MFFRYCYSPVLLLKKIKTYVNKKMNKKIILVTGGAGFIGTQLVEALLKKGDCLVVSLDNYFTGKKENHVYGVEYVEGHTKDIEKLITTIPDIVFHLGEYSRVEKSFDDMETVWDSNKNGTFAVLEFCRKHNVKLVYAGSSTKFGDGGLGRDQSPYAWTKASNTELVRNYGEWFSLKYAITYFYNVYGPREITQGSYATVIGIFREKSKQGLAIPVVSPGTQKRNFTHVEDIVKGLMLVGEHGDGDNYGLGSEESHSILDVAKMFSSDIEMLPERKGNRLDSVLDISRAKDELGWVAEKSLLDYIRKYIKS